MLFSSPLWAAPPAWVENLAHHGTLDSVSQDAQTEVICLALIVYYEARGESEKGRRAVAEVTMNRTRSSRYPSTVCEVMFQKSQFSFVKGRQTPLIPKVTRMWVDALNIAKEIYEAPSSNSWLSFCNCKRNGFRIGNHVFR